MSVDLAELSAKQVVEYIRDGEMSAADYAAQLLERIGAHARLNAFITIDEQRVLREARAVDSARALGRHLGPLAGLPFVVKDQIDVAGYPTTMGHTMFESYVATDDAAIVGRVLEAGGIVLAKTNCGPMVGGYPGRAVSAATNNNPYYGPARNPYDPTRMSGGSSGGNAVALAARLAPAGIGEDTGGSIRIPAAFCGIAGLRPSTFSVENVLVGARRKRYPDAGIVPPPGSTETAGPMARSVADVAFIDAVLTGEASASVSLDSCRLGIPDERYWQTTVYEPAVRAVTEAAWDALRSAGVVLVEIDLAEMCSRARAMPFPLGASSEAFASWLAEHVPEITLDAVARLPRRLPSSNVGAARAAPRAPEPGDEHVLSDTLREYHRLFSSESIDALAFPTQMMVAPLINVHEDRLDQQVEVDGQWVDELSLLLSTTLWGAMLGAPSLSVPVGLAGGLPVGMALQGLPGEDSRVLALGVAVEEMVGSIPAPPPLPTRHRVAARTHDGHGIVGRAAK